MNRVSPKKFTHLKKNQVVNNEFNINAVKVVKTTAGDHLYIRLKKFNLITCLGPHRPFKPVFN